MANNVAEIIIKVSTEGSQNARAVAGQLAQVGQTAGQVATRMLSAATAQRSCLTEIAGATAAYDSAYQKASEALALYEERVRHVRDLLQAGAIDQAEANERIRQAANDALPSLQKAMPVLEQWSAALRAAGKDTGSLDKQIESLKTSIDELSRAGQDNFAGVMHQRIMALRSDWENLNRQISDLTVRTIRDFSSATTKAIVGFITHTGNAREVFRQFALSVIEGIVQIVVQEVIANTIMRALSTVFHAEAIAQGTTTAASLSAAYATPATLASIFTLGVADAVGVAGLASALAAGTALSVGANAASAAGFAEGGLVNGPEGRDRIPAMLSNREFVLPAHATEFYGTALLESMRARAIAPPVLRSLGEGGSSRSPSASPNVNVAAPAVHVYVVSSLDDVKKHLASTGFSNHVVKIVKQRATDVGVVR
jgi:hypothetical protein